MLDPNSGVFLYLIAGGFTLLVGIVALVAYFSIRKNSTKLAYDQQLEDLLTDENDPDFEEKPTIAEKWNKYWATIARESGIARYSAIDNTAGRDIIFFALILGVISGVLIHNAIAGAVAGMVVIVIASGIMKNLAGKKADSINAQLPGFLFALKANVQANETLERAILKVIDGMPSPLFDEIVIVKHRLLASSGLPEALQELQAKTASRDLKFLCSCMIQANKAGANIEAQITTIQKVLKARSEVSDALNKAIKSVQPSIYIASIVIPGVFVITYMMDPNSRDFWFIHPFSWIALGAIIALWGLGIWLSKKLVDSIKNI
jgi:Flp pilus assembly protein TadB